MRINKFVASATGLSRRAADAAIAEGRVAVNGSPANPGTDVSDADKVTLDGQPLALPSRHTTILLNKPVGYVCSREGQGSQTIYDLLPAEFHSLKPVGRLDKDSSGLLLLTDNGDLAHQLTHPRYAKEKVYEVMLNKRLAEADRKRVEQGVELEDGNSKLSLKPQDKGWQVTMYEGRNRQIRRTFESLGYSIDQLRRVRFGPYRLEYLAEGDYLIV